MPSPPHDGALPESRDVPEDEVRLGHRFGTEPEEGYRELLDRYTPQMLQMIRRFFRDRDEVMEVYAGVCERLQAQHYAALRRFRAGSPIAPWLSIVVANAARDRLRRARAGALPQSLHDKLDAFERHVYRYHYRYRVSHEETAEALSHRMGAPYTARDVAEALDRINGLMGEARRWRLLDLLALRSKAASLDVLIERGAEPTDGGLDGPGVSLERQEQLRLLADALEAMEPEDRLLLQLRFEQNLTAPQIAEILGYDNFRYVYTRLQTLLRRLRALLDDLA